MVDNAKTWEEVAVKAFNRYCVSRLFVVVLREVTKSNPPILLAFWPVFFVAAIGEYPDMHLMPRLEYEPKFGAIMGGLFFVTSLKQRVHVNKSNSFTSPQ